ncbi:MAG: response regulator, partial [Anaerolineae bacterium]|nr:response regulator [Anaerolineae bacterium]
MDTRILLIDDDVRILQTFARTLRLADYTVFTAENGEQGLALYQQETPDIVLLDLRMPGMDGLQVLQAMRAHDSEANVILTTGHGDKDAVIEALRAGASDFLGKPIDQVTLESALRRAEERTHLKRELRASQEALRQHNLHLEEQVKARTVQLE